MTELNRPKMMKTIEDYVAIVTKWIDTAELDAFKIEDKAEFDNMQDRIIILKAHLVTAKAMFNALKEAMK